MSIIGAEDEFFENDLGPPVDDQCSHFNSIELLKDRPTHLLVFLQHVLLQFDTAPLLCYLHADLFKNLSAKETKKQFVDFYNTFLDKGAILRVPVPTHVSSEFDRSRPDGISEEMQKRFCADVQAQLVPEIMRQLEDFKQKKMMGMIPHEHELYEVDSHHPTERIPTEMKEKAVAETLLEKLAEIPAGFDEDKYTSIFTALVFYMKHLGVKYRTNDNKKSRGFFSKKNPLMRRFEDSARQRFQNIPWIGGSNEIKASKPDSEAEKEKMASPPRILLPEPIPMPFTHRKQGSIGAPGGVLGSEGTESSVGSGSGTTSLESSQSDFGALIRSEALAVTDGGDVSPAFSVGLPVMDSPRTSDLVLEDGQDGDSSDGGVSPAESSVSGSASSQVSSPQEELEPRLLELEQDPPNWRELAPSDALSGLSKKETKRQEVINELFTTEHAHVRMLSVLQTIFFRPLERREIMTLPELAAIFPNLDEIIEMHYNFYDNLKKLREEDYYIVKSLGSTLLNRFNGAEGDWFQKLTARFCSHQSYALDQIKGRQKRDPVFLSFIQEAESKPQCRRLQLKDIIPTEMQRLTKYPLLLENIARSTVDPEEKENVEQAAECCRRILNHVNENVKDMENLLTLKDYQRRLDTSGLKPSNDLYAEYKNIDLTQRKMIYEGPLTWRVTKEKAIDVQGVLLGDMLVLLQKQDDKMLLKCQSKSSVAGQEGKQMLSPVITLDTVFLRDVATDRKAFYVIFTWESGAQIYELVAHSIGEMKNWKELITSAVQELKRSEGTLLDRRRMGSLLPLGVPYSSSPLQSPQPGSENGSLTLKTNSDRDKDSLLEEKEGDSPQALMDHLLANGFDLIAHSNAPQEKVADEALKEVSSLRQLMNSGGSEGLAVTESEKNEGAEPETQSCESADGEQQNGMELQRKLDSLEEHVKHLKDVEDDYHRLQELLSKYILSEGNFQ